LADQGVDREPTRHKGPAVTAIERRGERSVVAERIRDDEVAERLSRAVEAGRLEREARDVARSILDTTSDLKAAIAERDAERTRSLDGIRQDARAAWLEARSTHAPANESGASHDRSLDLTGDLAAARRASREQWLAQRNATHESTEPITGTGQAAEKPPRRLILPDDDLSK
jgi:hypothetical protein